MIIRNSEKMIYLLFCFRGQTIAYNADDQSIDMLRMFRVYQN